MPEYETARSNMVDSQIRPNRITNPTLVQAMAELPREKFVPGSLRGVAYVDEDVPIGSGRYLMEPMVLARLIQLANVRPGDVALDIGCGTGYSAAVMARLCSTVVAVEGDPAFAAEASEHLRDLGVDNAVVVEGDLDKGYSEQAPYDVILLDGAVEVVPTTITDQLADHGRLVAVVLRGGVGRGTLVTRHGDHLAQREEFDAAVPLLPGFRRPPQFVF